MRKLHRHNLAVGMVGKSYGRLRVVAVAGRRYYADGDSDIQVRVVCACGREYVTAARWVRNRGHQCSACRGADNARRLARLARDPSRG